MKLKLPTQIITPRLTLRPFTLDDIEASYKLNLDPKVSLYTGDGGVVSYKETERRIKEDVLGDYQKYGVGRYAALDSATGKFIGFCGLKYLEDYEAFDLGYRFLSEYWGRGLATESAHAIVNAGFDNLDIDSILAFVLPENKSSVSVLDKLGFTYEDIVMEDGLKAHMYQLARNNWDSASS